MRGIFKQVADAQTNDRLAQLHDTSPSKRPGFHPLPSARMIPEPDYDEAVPSGAKSPSCSHMKKNTSTGQQSASQSSRFTEDGLVIPKKIANPCLECTERQNVHKELLFNHKIGKNVLSQKSELQKAMDKFTDDQKRKQMDQQRISKRNSFEKRLEEQALKLKENAETEECKTRDSEFKLLHAKLVPKS